MEKMYKCKSGRVSPKFKLQVDNRQSPSDIYAQNAIKKGAVKEFINLGVGSASNTPLQPNENNTMAEHLLHLKSSCSEMKKTIQEKEKATVRARDEIRFTEDQLKQIYLQRDTIQERIAELKNNVGLIEMKKETTVHSFKSNEHILERMKKDHVVNLVKKNQLEKVVTIKEKQRKELETANFQLGEHEQLSLNGLKEAQDEVDEQNSIRNKRLEIFNKSLSQKIDEETKRAVRKEQTDSIKEMAAGDLNDADLIRMKRFLVVQQFLKSVLKAKMNRLKKFYEPYENAFLEIKSKSCIKDATGLQRQFFSFQSSYNEKVECIKDLENQINEKEENQKHLTTKHEELRNCELAMLEELEQTTEAEDLKELKKDILTKAIAHEVTMMKVGEWLLTQEKKMSFNTDHSSTKNIANVSTKNIRIMKKICQILLKKKQQIIHNSANTTADVSLRESHAVQSSKHKGEKSVTLVLENKEMSNSEKKMNEDENEQQYENGEQQSGQEDDQINEKEEVNGSKNSLGVKGSDNSISVKQDQPQQSNQKGSTKKLI